MAMEINDIVGGRGGFGFGGGDAGGVVMGLILGTLFRNGGLNGGNDCLTQADLNGQTLGDIKAAVPLSEAQIQLALAGNQAALTQLIATVGNQLQNGQTALLLQTANQTAQLQQGICNVDTNVDRQSTAIQSAIHADGEATRALITSNRISDLEQRLTVAQLENTENRSVIREQTNSHNVTIQMQQQQQQQQLQMLDLRNQFGVLCGGINQLARATNSNVIVGSTGTATGAQTANPTNVVA